MAAQPERTEADVGVLGRYIDEGDECYGLFIPIGGVRVPVDIREDRLLPQREDHARRLFEGRQTLAESLTRFTHAHPEYSSRSIGAIGLHSSIFDRAEVFWNPEGYTLLKGLEFVADETAWGSDQRGDSWWRRLTRRWSCRER